MKTRSCLLYIGRWLVLSLTLAPLGAGCGGSDEGPADGGPPLDGAADLPARADGPSVDGEPVTDAAPPEVASAINRFSGPRRLRLELTPAPRKRLLEGKLARGERIDAVVSFAVDEADRGAAPSVEVYAMDAELEGGTPVAEGAGTLAAGALAAGAIRLSLTVEAPPASGRVELPFSFTANGRDGVAVGARLRWPGETHARAALVFAVDATGALQPSTVDEIRRQGYARLLADPATAAEELGASKALAFAKMEFEQRFFKVVDMPAAMIYPAECSEPGMICIAGRLAFDDPALCTGPVPSQWVPTSECHRLKQHFEASGASLDLAAYAPPEALRPLAARVEVSFVVGPPNPMVCGTDTVQTTSEGYFLAKVKTCDRPGTPPARVVARITPVFQVPDSAGTIRTMWETIAAATVVVADQPVEVGKTVYTNDSDPNEPPVDYSLPTLVLEHEIPGGEPATDQSELHLLALGTQVLLPPAAGDSFNYVREALSAHQTTVALHHRLQQRLAGSDLIYDAIFGDAPWPDGFNVVLDADWPHAGPGYIALIKPQDSPEVINHLSGTSVIAHELGHTIHLAFAPSSLQMDYGFANPMTHADGTDYDWGHGGGQYQELGTAFGEGMASALGQVLLNGCEDVVTPSASVYRPQGGAVPFAGNMWSGDGSCDQQEGCSLHHFRWQMKQRGVTEGSQTWDKRLALLRSATNLAVQAGHAPVTSNSESRVSELLCDLLDADEHVGHAAAEGTPYVPDFTGLVGNILDGSYDATLLTPVSLDVRQLGAPQPETIALDLPALLYAAGAFCGGGCQLPQSYGPDYTTKRLRATTGMLSPQRLIRHLVEMKYITAEQGRNVLRTNYMEEQIGLP